VQLAGYSDEAEAVQMAVAISTLQELEKEIQSSDGELWTEMCCQGQSCGLNNSKHQEVLAVHQELLRKNESMQWVRIKQAYQVSKTDLYGALIAICGNESSIVAVSGSVTVLNPFGYMPGETYRFLQVLTTQFYLFAALAYLLLGLFWLGLLLCHWSTSITFQRFHVPCVLIVCMIEAICYHFSWESLNNNGDLSLPLVSLSLVLNSAKHTFARVLLLMVSMGYGITEARLKYAVRIAVLGVLFFASNLGYMIVLQYSHMHAVEITTVTLASLPVSLTNSLFLTWIFSSLSNTIKHLKDAQQTFKLNIFQQLALLFGTAVGLSVLWFSLECYYRVAKSKEVRWQIWWWFEAAWHVIFYLMLVGVLALWRPNARSKDLAFTMELTSKGVEMQQHEEAESK